MYSVLFGRPWWLSLGKGSSHNAGDLGSIPGLGRSPGGGHDNLLQCSCFRKSHGLRRLALFWGAPKSLQMVIAAMKLKDSFSLEGKL